MRIPLDLSRMQYRCRHWVRNTSRRFERTPHNVLLLPPGVDVDLKVDVTGVLLLVLMFGVLLGGVLGWVSSIMGTIVQYVRLFQWA